MQNKKQLIGCIVSLVQFLTLLIFGLLVTTFELGPLGVIFLSVVTTITFILFLGVISNKSKGVET